ncbi:hypothetical protein D9611_007501 [Ephemerocybe angulata]|uniref:Uncharacterized protein n=1 Tax=Ephemerocybe angulata TaxID=980116 RepID=A0A8H5CGQ2_9AGAR|nr:hypothetical protein D9611_007501 [Tulosesus angulatus]
MADPVTLANTIPGTLEARSGFGVTSGPMRPVVPGEERVERERSAGAGNVRLSGLDEPKPLPPAMMRGREGQHTDMHFTGAALETEQRAANEMVDAEPLHHMDATGKPSGPTQHAVPFKERVVGVAQKTRGTLLGKPELKEHGEAILQGRTTHAQDKHND